MVNPTIIRGVQSHTHGKTVLGEDALYIFCVLSEDFLTNGHANPPRIIVGNHDNVVSDDFLSIRVSSSKP